MNRTFAICLASAAIAVARVSTVQAGTIVGSLGFIGTYTQNGGTIGNLATATSMTITVIGLETTAGDFTGAGAPFSFASPIGVNGNPPPIGQLWVVTVGAITYSMVVNAVSQTFTSETQLNLVGTGTIGDGNPGDDTPGTWQLGFGVSGTPPTASFTWQSTSADSLVVTNTNDAGSGSLRNAIDWSPPGSSITFAPNFTGTITLASELLINKSLNLVGPGANVLTISGNNASRVFHITGGTSTISNLRIANGHTSGGGGGILLDSGSLSLNNCAVVACYAAGDGGATGGGGILALAATTLSLVGCTLSGNSTPDYGGGLYLFNGANAIVVNSTISGNSTTDGSSDGGGGGIYVINGSTLNVTSSTIANNSSASAGGGVYKGFNGTATFRNSLVAGNSAPGGPDCKGPFVSADYNLIGNTSGSTGFGATGDQLNVNPIIGSLADNGGPTFTHALLSGSPAIDQGKRFGLLITDQRGLARPYDNVPIPNASGGDGSDIGAFEMQAPSGPLLTATQSVNGVVIAWPSPSTGFVLQQNANLNAATWVSVSQTQTDDGTTKSVLISPPVGNLYFRLKK